MTVFQLALASVYSNWIGCWHFWRDNPRRAISRGMGALQGNPLFTLRQRQTGASLGCSSLLVRTIFGVTTRIKHHPTPSSNYQPNRRLILFGLGKVGRCFHLELLHLFNLLPSETTHHKVSTPFLMSSSRQTAAD